MFIKEIKTRNPKTQKEYIKHTLVESVRTPKGPRQRTVMQLGHLKLPRESWPLLIAELESQISGQSDLNIPGTKIPVKVKNAANLAMERFTIRSSRRVEHRKSSDSDEVTVNLNELSKTKDRSFGAEFVAHSVWNDLKMPQKLAEFGFTAKERSLAEAMVCARLIEPDSELATWEWMKNSSAIGELTEESLDNVGLNPIYKISDKLLGHKQDIEKHLFDRESKLHPGRETLYLFDLTNLYFEGQALGNSLAQYAKSKEKRDDCPLVSLGLIVDSSGFPVTSEVFPGNIGEPGTLSELLQKLGYFDDYLPGMLPTLVMDRGIATLGNIKLLKDNNIPYILITRGPRNAYYLEEFENYQSDTEFKAITRNNKEIRIKEVRNADTPIVEILCVSEGRKEKEDAMSRRWTERASEDLASLQRSIRKGSIKQTDKIYKKIGRFEERYANLSKYFAIELIEDQANPGCTSDMNFHESPVFDIDNNESNPLHGTYVIETTLQDKSPEDIWTLYMTLTRVEEAFRCLKSELGARPIFHHGAERTRGHLFISILAYHLLINIEYRLSLSGDVRKWSTVCAILKSHQRSTVIIADNKQQIHHIRISSLPEPCHEKIYNALKIKPGKGLKKYIVAKRL